MAQRRMRAAIIVAPRRIRIEDVPLPEPAFGEVRVRVEGCGICASNLALWEGTPWARYPADAGAPGHEIWGRVDAVGEGVTALTPGQRVTGLAYRGYAEFDLAKASDLISLPDALKGLSFPGEAFGCAMNIFRRSEIEAGQTVAIVGIGFLGAILTRLASRKGARVIAISRRPFSLEIARKMGAGEVLPMDDHHRIIAQVSQLTSGKFCDRVIEAVGKQWPLDLGGELTRERGRLIIAGYHQDGPRQVNVQLWNWRGLDVVNAHERDASVYLEGIQAAIQAITNGLIDPSPLVTHRYPLEDLAQALDATADRPEGFLKAVMYA